MKKAVLISLIAVLVLVGCSNAVVQNATDCTSCHNDSTSSGGYIYTKPTIKIDSPMFVEPSSNLTIDITVTFSDYQLKDFRMDLTQTPRIISFKNTSDLFTKKFHLGNSRRFTFDGIPIKNGVSRLKFNFSYRPYYDHPADDKNDYGFEKVKRSKPVIIGSSSVTPSTWSLSVKGEEGQFELDVNEDIKNLSIHPPEGLKTEPSKLKRASKGETVKIIVKNPDGKDISDSILITWEEENNPHAIAVDVKSTTQKRSSKGYYTLTGRITGLMAISLFGFSIVLGMSKTLKEKLSWDQIVRYHCAISWFLLALAIYHGIILLIKPYYFQAYVPGMILAYLSTASMFIVSVNGSFMKQISNAIGGKNWRRMHRYFTITALTLGLIHGFMMGTDFALLRRLIGI